MAEDTGPIRVAALLERVLQGMVELEKRIAALEELAYDVLDEILDDEEAE